MSGSLRLEVFQNGELLRTIPFDGQELWLGRDEECVIRLDDRAISRKHALIRSTSNGIEFEKKSKFGMARLNGKETDHALIQGGERLELGSFEIRFVKDGAGQTRQVQQEAPAMVTHRSKRILSSPPPGSRTLYLRTGRTRSKNPIMALPNRGRPGVLILPRSTRMAPPAFSRALRGP